MEQISNPHDKFFKEALSRQEAAVDFVVHYLPKDIASLLNVDSLKISKDTFIDKELAAHLSDLLYHIDLRVWKSITHRFHIPASRHLRPILNRKILNVVLPRLRFCSIGSTKYGLNLCANSNELFLSRP